MQRHITLITLIFLLAGFGVQAKENRTETLIGTPITEPGWSVETRARLKKDLEIARGVMEIALEREDSHIWLGRRLGHLARNGEAVDVFTKALEHR